MPQRWLPLLASLVALSGCNLVAYDILAAGRDLAPADGGAINEQGDRDGGTQSDGGSVDVDPCASFNGGCDARATCERDGSNVICHCPAGYRANGKQCEDVNECLAADRGGCDKNANCINDPGTSHCQCKTGFDGDGMTCADINECETNNGGCDSHASCTNTVGGRTCECPLGYTGDGVTCTRSPWPKVGDLPTATAGTAVATWNDRLYVVGGTGISYGADAAWVADFQSDGRTSAFTAVSGPATILQNHCLVAANDRLYALGGSDFQVRGDVYVTSIAANGTLGTWAKTTALPSARTQLSCIAAGGRIYVFGGGYVAGSLQGMTDVISATINTDGTLSSWEALTSLPSPMTTFGVVLAGDHFFVLGGNPQNGADWNVYGVPLLGDGSIGTWSAAYPVDPTYLGEPLTSWNQQLHIGAGRLTATVDALGVPSAWSTFDPEVPMSYRWDRHATVVHAGRAYRIAGYNMSIPLMQLATEVRMEPVP